MYSKCFGYFLKKLFDIIFMAIIRMCNSNSVSENDKVCPYAFKAFNYEKILPNPNSKVPFPRSGHRIGADSSNFYSFGGYNPLVRDEVEHHEDDDFWVQSYPLFQELWKFNFASRQWTRFRNSQTLPMELASNALVLHRNILMVYGGTGSPFGIRCSNQLYVCKVNDENGLMVEVNTTGQLPLPLYGQALIFHNDYLYTIGGTTGLSYTCDIHRLNIKTMNWEIVYICNGQGEYEPKGRYRHEVGFDGKIIYVLGGGTTEEAYDFQCIPSFDVEKNVWFRQKTIRDNRRGHPEPRRCHGAVEITVNTGPQVFITGGHDGENIFNDLWRLDLKTYQWTFFEICQLPRPTYFHATAVSPEGRLYVFGGNYSINDDVRRSNTIYSAWLCIPKLSEICWEAVLYYSPHINKCGVDDLINIGLPRHFLQRLNNSDSCKISN
ncbi:kelch domain-containing protein 10 homolog isoform X2 [Anoplophora glabripennis]|uniref:kelch domain-containing protein 10 homolog isoform X2 n=1 Tax=Anoplophora glabripennis TaxID=217634 RepID=UPI0008754C20|nr:kelch domain-containing protein 10 homolog isoform X2 [Anoplophora glabripennis]